ncbi:MAG: alanine--glyoxylate aminotransferase family protein [Deltaproteobacteria bacterium]|nr:alanine--glyoxylate aminotransferase family protein [Deltaproteobacteria bacterium]MDO9209635.1 alanine--glyoxylate aminotransferase family protein [Deltaproteobacteria bacterium]
MTGEFHPPARILMGPGPSNVDPRVLLAMAKPMVGHLDPEFIRIMNNLQDLLRHVFGTKNPVTIPISGTGSAGMEAAFVNVVEPGDRVLVCINGVFGERMADVAERCGAHLRTISAPWGEAFELEAIQKELRSFQPKVLAIVHAETSTGVLQPLEELPAILKNNPDTLLLVDTVTSLGGHPVNVDEWGIDICYSGTQKCLSCPPGLAPITFSPQAMEKIKNRAKKVQSWYLDMNMVAKYWGSERTYHHTAPISMNYALLEALRVIGEEGLAPRHERHRRNHLALVQGIEAMGLSMLVPEPYRLWSLNAVNIPQGIDDAKLRKKLLDEYNLEIGGGLGVLKGKIWRVGLMGYSSSEANVLYFLIALEQALREQGFEVPRGAGATAAKEFFSKAK